MAQTAAQKAAAEKAAAAKEKIAAAKASLERAQALQKQSAQAQAKVDALNAAAKAKVISDAATKVAVKVDTKEATATADKIKDSANKIINKADELDKTQDEPKDEVPVKKVTNTINNVDGTTTIIYSDGTFTTTGTPVKPMTAADIATAVADAMAKVTAQQTAAARLTNQSNVTTALEDFKANLKLAGLDTLADTIDGYIKDDLTAAQIKINLVGTKAYKDRFPGMESLSKAGRAVNEATYISMEKGMTSILKAYGLDDKIFGTTEKLGTVIGNQVSVAEYEQRVSLAADKVKKNTDVLAALNEYYGVTLEGAISYLLDPKLGMDIVKKQIRASEIGAAAEMYKFDLDKAAAESYVNVSGTADLNSLKESFGRARILAETQTRLAGIEGDKTYNELQAVATTLGNDQQRMLESQRRALREQARFAGQSGISSGSLRKESNI